MRRLLISVLACLCAAGLTTFDGTVARAAATTCSGTFQVTSLTFDRPSVRPGQSFTATAVIQNCTDQPQTLRADLRARSVLPPPGTPYVACTGNDPYPMPEVQIAAGGSYSNSTQWSVAPNCPATAIQLTVYSWAAGPLAVATIAVDASSPPPPSCTATYRIVNEWSSGFVGQVTVTNTSGAAVARWAVTFTYPGDQRVTAAWNAVVAQQGSAVSATNASWDGALPAGGGAGFGLYGTWSRSDAVPTLLACQAS